MEFPHILQIGKEKEAAFFVVCYCNNLAEYSCKCKDKPERLPHK